MEALGSDRAMAMPLCPVLTFVRARVLTLVRASVTSLRFHVRPDGAAVHGRPEITPNLRPSPTASAQMSGFRRHMPRFRHSRRSRGPSAPDIRHYMREFRQSRVTALRVSDFPRRAETGCGDRCLILDPQCHSTTRSPRSAGADHQPADQRSSRAAAPASREPTASGGCLSTSYPPGCGIYPGSGSLTIIP
jgi:hypothetical protein